MNLVDTSERIPSADFIRAIAQLLETEPYNILAEQEGRCRHQVFRSDPDVRQHREEHDTNIRHSDYYLG
jgi:hypothetical protein